MLSKFFYDHEIAFAAIDLAKQYLRAVLGNVKRRVHTGYGSSGCKKRIFLTRIKFESRYRPRSPPVTLVLVSILSWI